MQFRFIMPALLNGGGPRNVYTLSGQLSVHGYSASVFALSGNSMFGAFRCKPSLCANSTNTQTTTLKNPLASVNFAIDVAAIKMSFLSPIQLLSSTISLATITQPAFYIATAWETAYPVLKVSSINKMPCFYFTQAYETTFGQTAMYKSFSVRSYIAPLIRFTQSAWLKNFLDSNYGGKTYYVGMGIDHSVFRPAKKNTFKEKQVLTIARAAKDKGFNIFVDAIKYLRKNRKDFKIIIVGEKEAVESQQIDFPYEFKGWLSNDNELANLYQNSIFVNTGLQEALPMPPLEAMACGATVVMTDMNGSKEYTQDYHNCLLAPIGDVKTIANKISEVLSSESLREELSRNALATAERYTWDSVVQRFEDMLKCENISQKRNSVS